MEGFALGVLQFEDGGGVGALAGVLQMHAGQLGGADAFGLADFQIAELEEQFADLGEVGGIIAALGDFPAVVLATRSRALSLWMWMAATSLTWRPGRSFWPRRPSGAAQESLIMFD